MAAVTQPNVKADDDGWTELSAATTQTLQLLLGSAGVIYADTQPAASVQVGEMGHLLSEGDYLNNGTGGISWGRADNHSRTAHFAITEG